MENALLMDNRNLIIRTETPRDFPKVYEVNSTAFGRSEEAQLVDRLRSGDTFLDELSLVACIDNKIVGHILFTKIEIVNNDRKNNSIALAPIAVLPRYQKKGIGSQLVKEGLKKAKDLGHKSVVVLGHERFYPKFGFSPAHKWNIKAPFNVPIASFMALELEDGAFDNVDGVVQYPKAFSI